MSRRMNARPLSVKVPVAKLIDLGEKKRARIIADHTKVKKSSSGDLAKARRKLAADLRKKATDVAAGRGVKVTTDYVRRDGYQRQRRVLEVRMNVEVGLDLPEKPDTTTVDSLLSMLRATSQEEMTVSEDSRLAYLINGATS